MLFQLRFSRLLLAALALVAVAASPARAQVGSRNTTVADAPVVRPKTTPCTVKLFDNLAFADFSVKFFDYAPPSGCAGPWAKVVLSADFNVTAGRQFDRTANVWIGGANIYFGTTAEPSRTVARSWHVERDLTDYSALLATAHPGEADLGNLVNETYTGIIYGSATLEFYPLAHRQKAPRTPDVVLPMSDRATGGPVTVPSPASPLSRSFTLPTNIERAYLDVIAESQGGDEFWYTCAPDDIAATVQSCGATGFRESEVLIDGTPAGVAPIYPWIYTGGIDPSLWAPIVGVQTLDFAPYRVDLTPFAGLLSDGKPHEVALSVFNANNYFSTTASLLLYLDKGKKQVTGGVTLNTLALPSPVVKENITSAADGTVSGTVGVTAAHKFIISGYVDTSHGRVYTDLLQKIDFSNQQTYDVGATKYVQKIVVASNIASETHTRGRDGIGDVVHTFAWPLTLTYAYVVADDGSAAQTTTVGQRWDENSVTAANLLPVDFSVIANRVDSANTLLISAAGAATGVKDQKSSQTYFTVDPARCYSNSVETAAGAVTAVKSGTDCF